MIDSLPRHLLERARIHGQKSASAIESDLPFVLYWMRTAVRSDENPALDVARWLADQNGIPLLVYHAISEHYRYASDRHHTFMLQGARDVQKEFEKLAISYAFHLATREDRRPHLIDLANMSQVVVTEDFPVDPPRRFVEALKQKTETPIISVDTACVAPMQLVKKAYTRAFKFRSATMNIYAQRLTRQWPELDLAAETRPFDLTNLPFETLDLQTADLGELVCRCEIDHAVGPVVDTVGGSFAGYHRWDEFKEKRIGRYAKQRNNALLDGVSRMSPYLHYGMVSPFRIAREAAQFDTAGSEKYLDELLIWRELAYAFCFYHPDHDQWSALPDWARQTLESHANDTRHETYSNQQLARGETNDAFWNAAQKSLLMHGELHNNVRMTWGKAILNWNQDPRHALQTIIDLNHRYALDGRDPASYGGILWCLGQFDRPFEPEQKVIGTVRARPTQIHASRLDTTQYQEKVAKPHFDSPIKIAIIGAGISGLMAARTLQDHGVRVTVFEKGRGVGGRMSTRRIGDSEAQQTFDHGAQYFTARNRDFIRHVDSWIEQGLVSRWPNKQVDEKQKIVVLESGVIKSESQSSDRFVAVPGMNAICKHLAANIEVKTGTRVEKIVPIENGVEIFVDSDTNKSLGKFNRVIVSAPAAQSAELLTGFTDLANKISKIDMSPCWATMVAFDKPITDQWAGAFLHESFLSWAARNSTKHRRSHDDEHVVIHAGPEWTKQHWEDDPNDVAQMMLNEFWRVTGISATTHNHLRSHRWKYAIPTDPAADGFFADETVTAVACGDWASGARVEGAFLSGVAAAGRIIGTLTTASSTKRQTTLF